MVLYVIYRASTESKHRSTIPTRLKELGCKQINKAFWVVEEKKKLEVLKILKNNYPIFLKRLREIKKPKSIKKKGFSRFGSLVVVTFALPKGTNREKLKNFLKKAACIRLRRSVYAFSQKHSFYEKEPKLVDAQKFVKFLRELQADVKIISRVIIVNTISEEILFRETRERIEKVVFDIINSCKEIYKKALSKEQDFVTLLSRFYRLKKRFFLLKKVTNVYSKWLKIDFSKNLMKAYHALRKVNSILESKKNSIKNNV